MTGCVLAMGCAALGALFQIQSVPWTSGKSTCFPADTELDGRADVFVLEDYRLRVYGALEREPKIDLTLPTGSGPLDIADIDHNGVPDLVTVCGGQVLAIPLHGDEAAQPRVLFTLESEFSHTSPRPFPSVLVVDRDLAPRIALPRTGALEIRDLQGELKESYPIDVASHGPLSIGRPFSYWSGQHAQLGPPDLLEFRVSSLVSYNPLQPAQGMPAELELPSARLGTPRQLRESEQIPPDQWPWFTVGVSGETAYRALYAAAEAREATAIIRIRSVAPGGLDAEEGAVEIGPARNFPGNLIVKENSLPDFDGDGYVDLMLWKPLQPGLTADGVARAVTDRSWPIRITTHLFMPDKGRYSPRPSGHFTIDVPLAWWFSPSPRGPLKEIILRDFNGDGLTDFGCFTRDDTLAVWTSDAGSFSEAPNYTHTFEEPMDGVVLEADLDGLGGTTIAVACTSALHIFRVWSPLSDF